MLYLTHTSGDPHDAIYIYPSPTNTSHILSPKLDVFSTLSSSTASSSDSEHSETNASQKNGFKPRGKNRYLKLSESENVKTVMMSSDMSRSIQVASCWCRAGASLGLASRKLTRPFVTKLTKLHQTKEADAVEARSCK